MDSFEMNKLIGAALGTVFVLFSVSLLGDSIFHSGAPETPGYAIAAAEPEAGAGAAEQVDITEEVFPLLASADAAAGEALFRRCAACHTGEEGGANKIGPNLYGLVNRPIASHEGFSYSAAMTQFSEGQSVKWDWDHLTHFLHGPKAYISGTAMSFAGLKKPDELANLLKYLDTLAANPAPLPEVKPAAEGEAAAPADGEAAPAEGEPAQNGAAPAQEGAAPAQEGAAPAQEENAPAPADAAAPAAAPATPGAEAAPGGEQAEPQQETAPAEGNGEQPAGEEETPPANQ